MQTRCPISPSRYGVGRTEFRRAKLGRLTVVIIVAPRSSYRSSPYQAKETYRICGANPGRRLQP